MTISSILTTTQGTSLKGVVSLLYTRQLEISFWSKAKREFRWYHIISFWNWGICWTDCCIFVCRLWSSYAWICNTQELACAAHFPLRFKRTPEIEIPHSKALHRMKAKINGNRCWESRKQISIVINMVHFKIHLRNLVTYSLLFWHLFVYAFFSLYSVMYTQDQQPLMLLHAKYQSRMDDVTCSDIWRSVIVPANFSLFQLHIVLHEVFQLTESQDSTHSFRPAKSIYPEHNFTHFQPVSPDKVTQGWMKEIAHGVYIGKWKIDQTLFFF